MKKKKSDNGSDDNHDDSDFANEKDDDNSEESDEDGFDYSENVKKLLVTYFNTAKLEELQAMITSKKLEIVISLRPFRSFGELVCIYKLFYNF